MNTAVPLDAQSRRALLQRISDILLRPAPTWLRIDAEGTSAAQLYKNYLIYLAAIPALASFIGMSLVGVGAFGMRLRVPIAAGLVNLLVGYVLTLVMVYVMALIANALAPRFQGRRDMPSALKLVAYGATAGLLAGALGIVPALGMLAAVGGLYSIYLIYLGAPVLMKVPRERAVAYTAVLLLCGAVAGMLVGWLTALATPGAGLGQRGAATLRLPGTDIRIDAHSVGQASRRLQEAQREGDGGAATRAATDAIGAMLGARIDTGQMDQASRQLEQARARGDSEAAAEAAGSMVSAALGGKGLPPLSAQQLRAVTPEQFAGLPRTAIKAETNNVMGMAFTQVDARYSQQRQQVQLRLKDLGAAPALAMGMASWASSTSESEDEREIERSYKKAGVAFREKYRKDGSRSELSILLPTRVVLEASGSLPIDELKQALQPVVQQTTALARPPA
ncbi:Yip1 family protein [Pulveribacter suum]|uniref:Yip1 domain-containing protein n=1 Tax=Pulveribacter suum TaxID=2116657 RepID=A0A2P1NHR3_9BURK|nr:Yip1 family protein [Pulveribacter suum]AVP56588.1 hypothetical protein C7H73_02115 [Pulveribacter suum]